jgi:hypothetical protein
MHFWQKHTEEEKQEDQNHGGYTVLRTNGNQQVSINGGRMKRAVLHSLSF